MSSLTMEDLTEKVVTPTSEADAEKESEKETEKKPETETEQDPLKAERERIAKLKEGGKSELDKALYSKKKIEERIAQLKGESPDEKSEEDKPENEDDKPVTIGMLKQMRQGEVVTTALTLADEIENENEREITKYHLEHSIKTTGNPQEDLKLARAIVNSVKNAQIAQTVVNKPAVKSHSSESSIQTRSEDKRLELTAEEIPFTKPPFNLSKEAIIKTRPKK